MKKAFLMIAFAGMLLSASAQGDKKASPQSDSKKVALKEHVCTKACSKDKCVYAHGEKGHVCTDACKKKM